MPSTIWSAWIVWNIGSIGSRNARNEVSPSSAAPNSVMLSSPMPARKSNEPCDST